MSTYAERVTQLVREVEPKIPGRRQDFVDYVRGACLLTTDNNLLDRIERQVKEPEGLGEVLLQIDQAILFAASRGTTLYPVFCEVHDNGRTKVVVSGTEYRVVRPRHLVEQMPWEGEITINHPLEYGITNTVSVDNHAFRFGGSDEVFAIDDMSVRWENLERI